MDDKKAKYLAQYKNRYLPKIEEMKKKDQNLFVHDDDLAVATDASRHKCSTRSH
jgi:hypothetical protein